MNCEIIRDLLPLYHDDVCSPESRVAVEDHLEHCQVCKKLLIDMDAPLPETKKEKAAADAAVVKKISDEWRKGAWKSKLKGAAVTAVVCLVLIGTWFAATQLYVFPVEPEKIQITNMRQLADGRILYHFYIDDDLNLRRTNFETDEYGNRYYVPVRALITEKRWEGVSPADREQDLNLKWEEDAARFEGAETLRSIWYGRGEDAILLWKEGMKLPPASEEDEAAWGYDEESAAYWEQREK